MINVANTDTRPIFAEGSFLGTCLEKLIDLVTKVRKFFMTIWHTITCSFFQSTTPLNRLPAQIAERPPVPDRYEVRPEGAQGHADVREAAPDIADLREEADELQRQRRLAIVAAFAQPLQQQLQERLAANAPAALAHIHDPQRLQQQVEAALDQRLQRLNAQLVRQNEAVVAAFINNPPPVPAALEQRLQRLLAGRGIVI